MLLSLLLSIQIYSTVNANSINNKNGHLFTNQKLNPFAVNLVANSLILIIIIILETIIDQFHLAIFIVPNFNFCS